MGVSQFKAFFSGKSNTYYTQHGDDILFKVSFILKNEDKSNLRFDYDVESPDALGAIAEAVPLVKRDYPLSACGTLRSDKFLDYAQVLVRKTHD